MHTVPLLTFRIKTEMRGKTRHKNLSRILWLGRKMFENSLEKHACIVGIHKAYHAYIRSRPYLEEF